MFGFLRRGKGDTTYRYPRCPECNSLNWLARGSGEMQDWYGQMYVFQYHQCQVCGLRMRLVRRLKARSWTLRRQDAIISD